MAADELVLRCPVSAECAWIPDYPDGYRDPPWSHGADPAEFLPVVHARQKAIAKAFNDHLASDHPELAGLQFEWVTGER